MIDEWRSVLETLRQPEYVHVLLNPLPVYGMACGIIALVLALVFRHWRAQVVGLVLVLLAAASVWPVVHYGERGYDRVYSMTQGDGQKWLAVHQYRAERVVWVYAVTGAVAVVAILVPVKFPRAGMPFLLATLLLAALSVAAGGWASHAGGQVRHPEFRNSPPPAVPAGHADE